MRPQNLVLRKNSRETPERPYTSTTNREGQFLHRIVFIFERVELKLLQRSLSSQDWQYFLSVDEKLDREERNVLLWNND